MTVCVCVGVHPPTCPPRPCPLPITVPSSSTGVGASSRATSHAPKFSCVSLSSDTSGGLVEKCEYFSRVVLRSAQRNVEEAHAPPNARIFRQKHQPPSATLSGDTQPQRVVVHTSRRPREAVHAWGVLVGCGYSPRARENLGHSSPRPPSSRWGSWRRARLLPGQSPSSGSRTVRVGGRGGSAPPPQCACTFGRPAHPPAPQSASTASSSSCTCTTG